MMNHKGEKLNKKQIKRLASSMPQGNNSVVSDWGYEESQQKNFKQTFTFKNEEQRKKSQPNVIKMLKFRFSRNFQT